MPRNIFAWTAPGADYPEYLSINVADGKIQVTVRGPKKPGVYLTCGDTVTITLPHDQVRPLFRSLLDID